MTGTYGGNLENRVQNYIKNWEMKVREDLECSTAMLFLTHDKYGRAQVKTKIETLHAVLNLLNGKNKPPLFSQLAEERDVLKLRLKETQATLQKTSASLFTHKNIIWEYKIQLLENYAKKNQDQVSVETAALVNLMYKLNDASKKIEELQGAAKVFEVQVKTITQELQKIQQEVQEHMDLFDITVKEVREETNKRMDRRRNMFSRLISKFT